MNAPITHFLEDSLIERKRILPGPAKILVRKGQIVEAIDPVVEEMISPAHILLDTARGLGVSQERAMELICCRQGAIVSQGELLAGPIGLTRRAVRAPGAGKITLIEKNKILLELDGKARQLKAGLQGEIVELISERGVVIECRGALIQAVWGNGKIGQGPLRPLFDLHGQHLKTEAIQDRMAGSILVSGYCDDPAIFSVFENCSINGVVLASMNPDLVPLALKAELPVILVEGFGRYPLNPVAYNLATSLSGFPAAINGEQPNRFTNTRPELVVQKPVLEQKSKQISFDLFAPGKIVRQVGPSGLGLTGELVDFIGDLVLPDNSRVEGAKVRYEQGTTSIVPLANLELLE